MNKKKQILIVEDNEINQEIISSILENDFNVLKANDGLEALKIIKDTKPEKTEGLSGVSIVNGECVLTSPNGNQFKLTVSDDGALITKRI